MKLLSASVPLPFLAPDWMSACTASTALRANSWVARGERGRRSCLGVLRPRHAPVAVVAWRKRPAVCRRGKRKRLGMPDRFGSCHTATIDGYVLEGHVPADDVKRLLGARTKAIGLAVPNMPVGSPGMEMGKRKDPYQVLLIDPSGLASTYASYPAPS